VQKTIKKIGYFNSFLISIWFIPFFISIAIFFSVLNKNLFQLLADGFMAFQNNPNDLASLISGGLIIFASIPLFIAVFTRVKRKNKF